MKEIHLPLTDEIIEGMHAGDALVLSGFVYVARDAAHKRMIEALKRSEPLAFDVRGQVIYYMGPSPARPGQVIGAAGPTTSGRMDSFTPLLIEKGLKGMIGKGSRSQAVKEAMLKFGAVYLGAVGGAGALISKTVLKSEVIAFDDLGPEAVLRLEVERFPATVIYDAYGGDLYAEGKAKYRK